MALPDDAVPCHLLGKSGTTDNGLYVACAPARRVGDRLDASGDPRWKAAACQRYVYPSSDKYFNECGLT